jgi:hypothetical protein
MAEAYSPTGSIDLLALLPQITRYCLSAGQMTDLALKTQFVNARCRSHQMVRLMEFSSTELYFNLSIRSVARAFNITHCAVQRALLRGYENPPGPGRHQELSPEDEQALVEWTAKKAHNHTAVTRTELLNSCIETFAMAVTRGLVDSFLSRDAAELFEMKRSPQENQRLEVPRVFLEAVIEGIRSHVHNACADLVFNLDEIGISEWEDRVERKVMAPSAMRKRKIFHGIHRGLKHISVITSISAGGDHMMPFLVPSQATDAVVRKLRTEGFRIGIDMILKTRDKPYTNVVLFHKYIDVHILEGDPFTLLRNISAQFGLIKGGHCCAIQMKT